MLHLTIDDFDLRAIAESGQCFRMTEVGSLKPGFTVYKVIAYGSCLLISGDPDGDENSFLVSCSEAQWENIYKTYFDLNSDYGVYRDYADKNDSFLLKCIDYGKGIRILNQEPWEMLISFIISQRKSVPAIRTTVERLCALSGDERVLDCSEWHAINPEFPESIVYYPFPSVETLAKYSLEDINSTGTGYRTGYIAEAGRRASTGELDLEALGGLSDGELLDELLNIQGVGIKVASCTALFGFHRISICPEDVWMKRVKEQFYSGEWPESYKPVLGVLQQYMFYYARLEHEKEKIKEIMN